MACPLWGPHPITNFETYGPVWSQICVRQNTGNIYEPTLDFGVDESDANVVANLETWGGLFDDGQGRSGELFRFDRAATGQKPFERDGIRCVGKLFLELSREFDDALSAFGRAQNAAKRWKYFASKTNRGHGIRGHYELLDQLCRPVGLIPLKRGMHITRV